MKRILLTIVAMSLMLGGIAFAQSEADQSYIKAMQANSLVEKAKLLKEYISQYAGKGNQYDSYAYANLGILQYQSKQFNDETIGLAEKAIAAGGIDDMMRGAMLYIISDVHLKMNQFDKAKAAAQQVIQHANAAKGKEAEAANAKAWSQTIGQAYCLLAQAQEKSGDIKSALESYNQAYIVTKSVGILGEVKKIGKTYYDAGKFAEAEPVFRYLSGTGLDSESMTILAQILNKQGKQAEAKQMFQDMYAKNKTGAMAYNIGIMLANEAKTNPAVTDDAVAFLLDASFLDPKRSKQCLDTARYLFFSQDKEWNSRIKAMEESQALVKDWTNAINTKFGDKGEEDLTPDERREYRKLKELIDKETVTLNALQAQMKSGSGKFDGLVAAAKKRTGK
ncbi:MAG: tetratricopeptide repeat protein [Candidatus Aminicenantales bacterium]